MEEGAGPLVGEVVASMTAATGRVRGRLDVGRRVGHLDYQVALSECSA